ncbi:FAD/NAD(P)-binding domain-containing protein [Aspergillus costaricaensis CBS 115574]|uniref:FAD/NAD(P)-binding domain-containing protein n=1 Tax=Aspergillus costaricaensis CBS 115574 TaxID=1448317 RepID=A0ACD1IBB7_9EURO|nr:FAD/NAD(P)-binding domain-containing protein [Aspergillus costaricaensis CBS 115574]RAK87869.1 FAD/NAD(P)-binding domain-containing protein [Aspergillus costaricaensis CBS 115574]
MHRMDKSRPVLIIGAGLSGLALGRILTNNNIPNIVFEASSPERSQGFAISMHDWGYSPLLEALGGLSPQSMTKAVAPDRFIGGTGWVDLAMRDNMTGQILVEPDANARPAVVRANRNALRAWIADCGDDQLDVRYGHKLKIISGSMGNVQVVFENGAVYDGSTVVAADGVHSTVRSQVLPHIVPEVVPVVIYHGEFEVSRDEYDHYLRPVIGNANILAGVGDGFNTPITVCNITKTRVHLDWSYSRPASGENDPLFNDKKPEVQMREPPQALLDELPSRQLAEPWARYINSETIRQHSVFHWISRCVCMPTVDALQAAQAGVVFVGDSWHAMPIFGGEGGNHALVDSTELAAAMIKEAAVDRAVSVYYQGAARRCQEAVRRSRSRFYVLHRPIAEWREIAEKRRAKAGAQAAD